MIHWVWWIYEQEDDDYEWYRVKSYSFINLRAARGEMRYYRNHSKRKNLGRKYIMLLGRKFVPND